MFGPGEFIEQKKDSSVPNQSSLSLLSQQNTGLQLLKQDLRLAIKLMQSPLFSDGETEFSAL